jgi:hypothetical protein
VQEKGSAQTIAYRRSGFFSPTPPKIPLLGVHSGRFYLRFLCYNIYVSVKRSKLKLAPLNGGGFFSREPGIYVFLRKYICDYQNE